MGTGIEPFCDEQKQWCEQEFSGVQLGDKRLNRRFIQTAVKLSQKPEASINKALEGDWAQTKASYRMFDNQEVTPQRILSPHQQQTLQRVQERKLHRILAIQDTCFLNFNSHLETQGLGPIGIRYNGKSQSKGLVVHTSFAMDPQGEGLPLGILAQDIWARKARKKREKTHKLPIQQKESFKWIEAMNASRSLISPEVEVVHVCDREADVFEFLAEAEKTKNKYLVRASADRRLKQRSTENLLQWMEKQPLATVISLDVPAQSRTKDRNKREERIAQLEVRFSQVQLQPSVWIKYAGATLPPVLTYAIWVKEINPPKGVKPIEWMLLTNVAIKGLENALERVRWYRLRWHIENYHRVLKSGCRIEDCRLETAERLERYITLFSIIAWRLYWMNRASRIKPEMPCTEMLAEHEWKALYMKIKKQRPPKNPPSIREAVRWIASLGGFLGRKSDGEPGSQTLWKGWQELAQIADGYLLFQSLQNCG